MSLKLGAFLLGGAFKQIKILIVSEAEARRRGARELHLPDWPYGAVGRRLILEAFLIDPQPPDGWSKAALELRARTRPGGADGHLAGALDWGIAAQREDGSWSRAADLPRIASPLEELLRLTREAQDRPIVPLTKRAYRRTPRPG